MACDLEFQVHDMDVKKMVLVSDKVARLSPETLKGGIVNFFFSPGEPSLPMGTIIESIEVKYPSLNADIRMEY